MQRQAVLPFSDSKRPFLAEVVPLRKHSNEALINVLIFTMIKMITKLIIPKEN